MASKTTKVTALIAAQVTGTDDVSGLADKVTGIPDKTTATVTASVTGDADVAGLSTDLDALPATTDTKVAARVTGDADVAGLHGDLTGLPATTDTKVAASVSGDEKVDALVRQLTGTPKSTTFSVTANIKETGAKGGVKQVGADIDEVKGKASGLATSGAGFASQFLGPYSQATGIFGDLTEQLASMKDEAGEGGAGGALKGLGAAAAGIGVTVLAGLAVDSIVSAFGEVKAAQQEVQGVTESLTQTLVDNGGAWDANAERALIASVSQTGAFKTLSAAGIDYGTIIDGLTGKAGGMDKLSLAVAKTGNFDATKALKEANALSKVGANSRHASQDALDYAKKNGLLTDAQKAGITASEDHATALDLAGDAAKTAAGKIAGVTGDVKTYNGTTIPPKNATITGDAGDAHRAIDGVNAARVPDKSMKINGDDADAQRKIAGVKAETIPPKDARINVTTGGTEAHAEGKIQQVADTKYKATISVEAKIAKGGHGLEHGWKVTITPGMVTPPASGASAPSAQGLAVTAGASTGATYRITINGAVDKDGTARTLQKILDGRARRIGPTQLGRRGR